MRVQKSFDTLINAINLLVTKFKISTKIRLMIVGSGPDLKKLEDLVRMHQLESIIQFCGNTNDTITYYKASDLYVISSVFEGLPLTLLEAMSIGLPIVSSNIPGPNDIIVNDESGLLFESTNSSDLAECINKVISNPLLKNRIAKSGQNNFRNFYNMKSYCDNLISIYSS